MSAVSAATVIAGITAAAAVAGTVYEVTRPGPQAPKTPDQLGTAPGPVPGYTDPAIQAAAALQNQSNAAAKGRASTIATGGQGDTSPLTTNKKTLLGAG